MNESAEPTPNGPACPSCQSTETVHTMHHMGENMFFCPKCEHSWWHRQGKPLKPRRYCCVPQDGSARPKAGVSRRFSATTSALRADRVHRVVGVRCEATVRVLTRTPRSAEELLLR